MPADHGQDVTSEGAPAIAHGQANSASLGQAAGGQAGPRATAANGEKKAERAKGDRHIGKYDGGGGGGAAAAEADKGKGKGRAEKTQKPARAQLVISLLSSALLDRQEPMAYYVGQSVCVCHNRHCSPCRFIPPSCC